MEGKQRTLCISQHKLQTSDEEYVRLVSILEKDGMKTDGRYFEFKDDAQDIGRIVTD